MKTTIKKLVALVLVAGALAGALTGCQTAQRQISTTPTVVNATAEQSINAVMNYGFEQGYDCNETKRSVTCEVEINGTQAIFIQALMVGPRGEAPHRYFKFNFMERNGVTQIKGKHWLSIRSVYGSQQNSVNTIDQASMDNIVNVINNSVGALE